MLRGGKSVPNNPCPAICGRYGSLKCSSSWTTHQVLFHHRVLNLIAENTTYLSSIQIDRAHMPIYPMQQIEHQHRWPTGWDHMIDQKLLFSYLRTSVTCELRMQLSSDSWNQTVHRCQGICEGNWFSAGCALVSSFKHRVQHGAYNFRLKNCFLILEELPNLGIVHIDAQRE